MENHNADTNGKHSSTVALLVLAFSASFALVLGAMQFVSTENSTVPIDNVTQVKNSDRQSAESPASNSTVAAISRPNDPDSKDITQDSDLSESTLKRFEEQIADDYDFGLVVLSGKLNQRGRLLGSVWNLFSNEMRVEVEFNGDNILSCIFSDIDRIYFSDHVGNPITSEEITDLIEQVRRFNGPEVQMLEEEFETQQRYEPYIGTMYLHNGKLDAGEIERGIERAKVAYEDGKYAEAFILIGHLPNNHFKRTAVLDVFYESVRHLAKDAIVNGDSIKAIKLLDAIPRFHPSYNTVQSQVMRLSSELPSDEENKLIYEFRRRSVGDIVDVLSQLKKELLAQSKQQNEASRKKQIPNRAENQLVREYHEALKQNQSEATSKVNLKWFLIALVMFAGSLIFVGVIPDEPSKMKKSWSPATKAFLNNTLTILLGCLIMSPFFGCPLGFFVYNSGQPSSYESKEDVLERYHQQNRFRGYTDADELERDMKVLGAFGSEGAQKVARELQQAK